MRWLIDLEQRSGLVYGSDQPTTIWAAPETRLPVRGMAVKTAATRTQSAFAGSKPLVCAGGLCSDRREFIRQVQFPNHRTRS